MGILIQFLQPRIEFILYIILAAGKLSDLLMRSLPGVQNRKPTKQYEET
jgi:hypothetical protein